MTMIADAAVGRAMAADAAELCVLQRCCWVSEAILNNTLDIPALHETLDDVRGWIASHEVWVVRLGGRLVGAVRAHQDGDRWEIGRLMVAPDLAGHGLGRRLLEQAEAGAPAGVRQFVLFTGSRSERNQRMYGRAGYLLGAPPAGAAGQHIQAAVFMTKQAAG